MEISANEWSSGWIFPLLKEKPLANQEPTVPAALLMKKLNSAHMSGSPAHNPSMSSDVASTSEWRRGKNYERN